MTTQDARELVRDARLVHKNQATAKALHAGEISTAHVNAAARAARHVEDLYADHEEGIVDAARITAPDEFRTVINHWRSLAENLVAKESAAERFTRRHLHISPVLDSMARIDGWIDAQSRRVARGQARFARASRSHRRFRTTPDPEPTTRRRAGAPRGRGAGAAHRPRHRDGPRHGPGSLPCRSHPGAL